MTKYDGKVVISTELDNSQIPKDAKSMAASLAAEYRKAGMDAAGAFKKAWAEVKKTSADPAPVSTPVIDLDTGQVTQASAEAAAAANAAAQAGQNAVNTAKEASAASAQASASLGGTAQAVEGVTSSISEQDQKIQGILADTERSAKSKAASIAAVYRQQGYSQQEAFKMAWEKIERTSSKSTQKVGQDIRNNVGGSTQAVTGQLGGLNNVLGKLASTIGAVFSVAAIIRFGAESVKAANELSDALTGLQSILEGQGKSFAKAQRFIDEYTSDGLIPATNAITAYKNLASRGYDDSQIQQVMVALKDASAFGRQASYSMGDAVQSATEGLKNENSVLVDNAGVTKNVAKMWEEYAASIGTTANNLTQQQKIQAEVTGILEESKFQTGDAAKVAGTLSGQLQQLSFNLNNLKVAVGNATKPFVQVFLPIINAAISAITRFANTVASVVNALFGTSSTVADGAARVDNMAHSYSAAADSAEEYGNAASAAAKKAKKALAGFDEITKLGSTDTSGSGSSPGGVSAGSTDLGAGLTFGSDEPIEDKLSPQVQVLVDKVMALIEPLKNIDLSPAMASFGRLADSVSGLGAVIGEHLEWAWFNVLVPLSQWTIEEAAPATVDLLSAALDALAAFIDPISDGLQNLYEDMSPVIDFIADTVLAVLDDWKNYFNDLALLFEEKGPEISDIITAIGDAFSVMWPGLKQELEDMQRTFGNVFSGIGTLINTTIGFVIDVLYGLTEFIAGALTGDWDRAWGGITKIFEGAGESLKGTGEGIFQMFGVTFEDIQNVVKGAINGIIGFANGLASAVTKAINAVIKALNKISIRIPDWFSYIPGMGGLAGKNFGFNISTLTTPKIPYLAKGAVLPANKPFLAMVGDQRHGTNVEAPLSTIQEAVALVMEDYAAANLAGHEATVAVLRDILEAVLGIEIGDSIIGAAAARYNARMNIVKGGAR